MNTTASYTKTEWLLALLFSAAFYFINLFSLLSRPVRDVSFYAIAFTFTLRLAFFRKQALNTKTRLILSAITGAFALLFIQALATLSANFLFN
ncbi:hypothetical protein COB21_02330 [Candidatus Aerophobetes bacterium]|uniref:Uncharacterized protein n=1 Tax=Aerophobetes bacterium TaxID=2030807 RepID=A0A2A4X5I4_UNCAE|nr:MAG: hypothetical protein COB21_02330 [Candidatus Aerophobetes bacterium]